MPRAPRIPSLRRHKPSGQGVVTLNNHDHYLGRWPSDLADPPPEVRAEYDRLVSEWLASGRRCPSTQVQGPDSGISINELVLAFWTHAEQHYRYPDGKPTNELSDYRLSLRPLKHLYGSTPAQEFGPLALKAIRQLMIDGYDHPEYGPQPALSRGVINQRIGRIVRAFKWAVAEELVEESTWRALTAVKGLEKGRSKARETEPVEPVALAVVEKTLPHLTSHLQGAVRFQLHTGARPGEALAVRLAEVDRSGNVWLYRPRQHKTAHKNKARVIPIGRRGQEVMRDFIRIRCPLCGLEGRPPRLGCRDGALCGPCADRMDEEGICGPWPRIETQPADAFLFSPAVAMAERDENRRKARKSKVQPSQVCRKKAKPKRKPGPCYTRPAYEYAISRVCEKHGLPHWHPHQLRHNYATEVRRHFGLEAAQVALGHSQANVTQIYAERDLTLAVRVAAEMG
jgi:integrase